MLANKMLLNVIEILLVVFAIFLFSYYKKKEKDNNCIWLHHFCSLAVNAFEY